MHQILTEKEQRLIRDLREQEGKIVKTMEKNLREIQEELSKLQKKMEQKDRLIFMKEEVCRKRRISEDYPVLSVADGALSIGKFNGPLQYTAWREMIDAINPACSGSLFYPSLEFRSLRCDLIEVFKILRGTESNYFRCLGSRGLGTWSKNYSQAFQE
uniref:E3 ubiquitin-protein ligase TRIM69-like n=1 Tax=Pristiophorus japonicus TaxID=55135 RepID=UPI00398E4A4D